MNDIDITQEFEGVMNKEGNLAILKKQVDFSREGVKNQMHIGCLLKITHPPSSALKSSAKQTKEL